LYHVIDLNTQEIADFSIDFSYSAVSIPDGDSTQELEWSGILPWGLGIIGAGLIGFAIYNITRTQTTGKKAPRRRSKSRSSNKLGTKYCHYCGNKLTKTDKFCSECGKKVR
jgi:hypothetical protein